ncbi:MAG: hypothetical protein AAGN35_25520 [Bacteroidota bacterium]
MKDSSVEYDVRFGIAKLWKWKWWIFGACVVAAVVSIYLTSRMPDEFKSTAAFVPPSYTSLGTMVFGNGIAYRGFYAADEEDIDRTVAYLESTEVMDTIAKRFDLYAHYGLDPGAENAAKKFYNVFRGNINISFASNSVVEVECWDPDPQFSSDMASAYLEIVTTYFEDVSQRKEGLAASYRQLQTVEDERKAILDSLAYFRSQYGVYHLDNAGEAVSAILAQSMRNEPKFHEYYDAVKSMETYISTLELRYGDLKREVMARELNIEQFPSLIWVTEEPAPSAFKDRPKRSIIVILAVLGMIVFSSFLVIVLDRAKAV